MRRSASLVLSEERADMTAIAIKDGIIVADTMMTRGGRLGGGWQQKISFNEQGLIFAGSGYAPTCQRFITEAPEQVRKKSQATIDFDYREKGDDPDNFMIVAPDGDIFFFGSAIGGENVCDTMMAMGDHSFLMGAMLNGASAEDAVRLACEYSHGCGGPLLKIDTKALASRDMFKDSDGAFAHLDGLFLERIDPDPSTIDDPIKMFTADKWYRKRQ